MITHYKKVLVLLLALLHCVNVQAQTNWEFQSDKDGIKSYTREVPNSRIKAVKLETTFQSPLNQVVGVLLDIKNSVEWAYKTKSVIVLKQVSTTEVYYYSEINMPWPIANRDFVGHLLASQNPDTKVVSIGGPVEPGYVPVKKGLVRIEKSVGQWVLTPINDHETKIEYSLQVDPGGSTPAWLVNLFAAEGPRHSLKNLRLQVNKPNYKNFVMPFNRN